MAINELNRKLRDGLLSMADLHLLDFYKDTAQALVTLHNSFPRKIELYVEDLIGPDHVDEFGLHSKRHEACLGAFLWLADENYIRFQSTIRQEAIDQAILTSKAVVLLATTTTNLYDNTPAEVEDEKTGNDMINLASSESQERLTLVQHIRRAIKSQSSVELTHVMKSFFEMGHSR